MIKKALIVISVASTFALVGAELLVAAEKSVSVGGRVRAWIQMTDSSNNGTTTTSKPMHFKADSRLGASGSTKDGGYTGSFHVERGFNNGAMGGEGNRNAYVKLATAGWSVSLGKQAQPYICHTGKADLDNIGGNDCPMWSGRNESLGIKLNNVGPATVGLNYQANNVAGTDEHQTRVIPHASMAIAGINLDLVIVSGSTKSDKGWGFLDNGTATKSTESQTALAVSGSAGDISYAVGMNNSSNKVGDADAVTGAIITLGVKYSLGDTGDIGFLYDSNTQKAGDITATSSGTRFSYGTTIAGVKIGAGMRNATSKASADADAASTAKMSIGFQYGF